MNFYQTLTLLLVAALPFFPRQLDERIPYIIIASGIIFLPLFLQKARHRIYEDTPVTLFLIFLIVLAFSTIFSVDRGRSLIQLATYISYFVIFTSVGSVFYSTKSKERLALLFLIVTCLLSLISLYNTLIVNYVNHESMGVSFMWVYYGHNHLSALLVFAIPVAFYFLKTYWKTRIHLPATRFASEARRANYQLPVRFFWLFTIFYLLFSIYITFSRSTLITLFTTSFLVIFFFSSEKRAKPLIIAAIGVLFIAATISFNLPIVQKSLIVSKTKVTLLAEGNRFVYWQQAARNLRKHPLFGSGLDTFRFLPLIEQPKKKHTLPRSFFAHNFFLQMASDAGIPGLLSSLTLIALVLWKSAQKIPNLKLQEKLLRTVFFAGILASTMNTFFDFDWQLPYVFLIFWIFAGILASPKNH